MDAESSGEQLNQAAIDRRWELAVYAKAVGQPRPRHSKRPGRPTLVYTPNTADEFKAAITTAIKAAGIQGLNLTGSLGLYWAALFPRPKTHYRTGKHAGDLKKDIPRWHTGTPNVKNISKAIMDTLQANGVIRNDSQFAEIHGCKQYTAAKPQVSILIKEL